MLRIKKKLQKDKTHTHTQTNNDQLKIINQYQEVYEIHRSPVILFLGSGEGRRICYARTKKTSKMKTQIHTHTHTHTKEQTKKREKRRKTKLVFF